MHHAKAHSVQASFMREALVQGYFGLSLTISVHHCSKQNIVNKGGLFAANAQKVPLEFEDLIWCLFEDVSGCIVNATIYSFVIVPNNVHLKLIHKII